MAGWDTIVVDYHYIIAREDDTVNLDSTYGDSYCIIDHSTGKNTYRSSYLHNRCTLTASDHTVTDVVYGVSLAGDTAEPYRGPFWGGTIDLANGNDDVILRHTSDYNGVVSHISLYGGNDSLRVTGPYEVAMKYTEADLGDGDDLMEVSGVGKVASGSAHNVTIRAGAGKDTLSFKYGINVDAAPLTVFENWRNFIDLGDGEDRFTVGGRVNKLDLNAGADDDGVTIVGSADESNLSLGGGADTMKIGGSIGNSAIDAGAGADGVTIGGAVRHTRISLGDGDDTLSVDGSLSSSSIDAGAGADGVTVTGALSSAPISLGTGNDTFSIGGDVNTSTVDAGAGDDGVTIAGGLTNTAVFLGAGNDTLSVKAGVFTNWESTAIDLGADNDALFIGEGINYATLIAGDGDDTVTLEKGIQGNHTIRNPAVIDLGEGTNRLLIGPSQESGACLVYANVLGGSGRDIVSLRGMVQDSVTISLAGGDDVLLLDMPGSPEPTSRSDKTTQFHLGDGNDLVSVKGSIRSRLDIDSGNGNDSVIIDGLSGNSVQAGAGSDAIGVNGASNTINLTADADVDQVTVGGDYNTIFAYKATGGGVKDKLTVDGAVAYIVLEEGMTARDLDVTGSGSWVLIGGGSDTSGGDTVEPVVVDGVTINAADGRWILTGRGPDTVKANRYGDSIFTDGGDDMADVTGGNNYVNLGTGNDTLVLSGDNSTIVTGAGADEATVNSSNAKIDLGEGSDTLQFAGLGGTVTAGLGDDILDVTGGTGHTLDLGSGADSVSVRATYETIYAGTGDDTIIFDGTGGDGFHYIELVEDNNLVSVRGGDGHTTIQGGVSADSLLFTGGDVEKDVISLAGGNDFVFFDSQAGQSFGGNIARANNTTLRAGIGDDSVYAWSAEQVIMDGGTGDDSINIVNARYTTIVSGSGDDSIVLGMDASSNTATDNSTGYNVINLRGDSDGNGHNIVTIGGGLTNNSVFGGSEKDVIDLAQSGGRNAVTLNAKESTITAGVRDDTIRAASGGIDIIDGRAVATGQEVVISNYSIADKDILTGTKAIAYTDTNGNRALWQNAFVGGTSVFKADGTILTGQDGAFNANLNPTAGDNGVQVYVRDTLFGAETQAVWFATSYGSDMNAAKDGVKIAMVMTGANNGAADTMLGGELNDTLYAGNGDIAAGGKGNDTIINTGGTDTREQFGLAKGTGKDTVQNFAGGFGSADDAVTFYENSLLNGTTANYDGNGNLTLTNGNGSLTLQMAAGMDSTAAHAVLKNGLTGDDERLSAIRANATEKVTDDTVAKYYYGSKQGGSAIDASELSTGVKVDLSNSGRYFAAGENYSYITAVKGSDRGDNFLAGNGETAETLTGGSGVNNTLYGGGSANDLLIGGGTDALGIAAQDNFYFGPTDGKDVIRNIGNGDKVMLYDLRDDGSVTAETTTLNGASYLLLTAAATGAQIFLQDAGSETYEVLFTDGVNDAMTAKYEVTGTEFRKVM